MKKILTLMTLLVAIVTGAWAQGDPTWSINTSSAASSAWATGTPYSSSGATISLANDVSGGSSSYDGGYYKIGNGPAADFSTNYVEVTSNEVIEKITFIVSGNNSTATSIKPTVVAWEGEASSTIDQYWVNDATAEIGRNYSDAIEQTYTFTGKSYKRVRIVRSNASGAGTSTTFRVWGVKVWLKASGPVDPTFSLTKSSIGTNETSQIQVGTKGNLDGITFNGDVSYGTEGVVTVSSTGLVTPVAPGTTTLTFSTNAVDGKYNASSNKQVTITVTAPTYAVNYNLNGGSGDAPTQDPQVVGAKFNLAAAPTKDFSTFAGWLCNVDGHTYDAGDEYTMTAEATTFTAQWNVTTYSSTLDFGAITKAGTTASNPINTFLASGNMVASLGGSSAWETSIAKSGFIGYKLKNLGATVKFMAMAGKKVTITLGSNDGAVTLKKNGVSSSIADHKGDNNFSVIAFDADVDMLVEIVTTSGNTTTLNKIEIEDAIASTSVPVGETGFATVGLPYASVVPEDVTAYAANIVESELKISDAIASGSVLPANKGFIIVADPGSYDFDGASNITYQGDAGILEATGAASKTAASDGEFYYFAVIDNVNKAVGFKKIANGGTLAANKAYLPSAAVPNNVNALIIDFSEVTAVQNVEAAPAANKAEVGKKAFVNGHLVILTENGFVNALGQTLK